MKQSQLFLKTFREAPKDESALNAVLLIRAGFINKEAAGIYTYLPLGLRVINNIARVIREEMFKLGANEILMPSLHSRESWEATGRYNSFDVLFKVQSQTGSEFALGPTHEEIVYPLAKRAIASYKDLPLGLFQIQNKFRDEMRAKSGLLRGKEFLMKDLYSFHTDKEDLLRYKARVDAAYLIIFSRLGLNAIVTNASGGAFSKYSTEFQVATPAGEDTIYVCKTCNMAWNKEVFSGTRCEKGHPVEELKSIEVGNTFELGTRFSEAVHLTYRDQNDKEQLAVGGCYGIGLGRVMGAIAEVNHDAKGIIWPLGAAPFAYHLLSLMSESEPVRTAADRLYAEVQNTTTVLYDDREKSAGEKLVESDLLGIPYKIVMSEKTVKSGKAELIERRSGTTKLLDTEELIHFIHENSATQ